MTHSQLDALGSLLACEWFDALAMAEAFPDKAHIRHLLQLELLTNVVHRLAARVDGERAA